MINTVCDSPLYKEIRARYGYVPGTADEGRVYTVLLVDNEECILNALSRVLRQDGYHILTAMSGEEGLEALRQNDVALVITDNRMPGMSGADFLSRVRNVYPDTVRCMLTGYVDIGVMPFINNGAVTKYLAKPWENDKLRKTIKESIELYALRLRNRELIDVKKSHFMKLLTLTGTLKRGE